MGSYSDSLSATPYQTAFFDSLSSCLHAAAGAVAQMAILRLHVDRSPNDEGGKIGNRWSQDSLLVYKGVPLVAVAIRVEGSSTNMDLSERIAKGAAAASAVGSIKAGIRERLLAADAPEVVAEAPKPTRVMAELAWRITLRRPNGDETIFKGGPFNFDQIENAFDAIGDILETAIKAAKTTTAPTA
jgi:hypothetical protein